LFVAVVWYVVLFIFIVYLPVGAVQRLEQTCVTCVTGSAKKPLEICLVFLWLLVLIDAIVVVVAATVLVSAAVVVFLQFQV